MKYQNFTQIIDNYDLFLFDLWGVLIEDEVMYAKAIDTVNTLSLTKPVCLITNSPLSQKSLCHRLEKLKINIPCENIFSSGEVAKRFLKNNQNTSIIYVLGGQNILNQDYNITDNLNEANILLLNVSIFSDEDQNQFDDVIKQVAEKKIKTICINPDVLIPSLEGKLKYGPGFFAKKIKELGGDVVYTGKPHSEIYNMIFDKFSNIPLSKILMVGDTLETDILGAIKNNIHSALVMTGNNFAVHHKFDNLNEKINAIEKEVNKEQIIPNYIVDLGK